MLCLLFEIMPKKVNCCVPNCLNNFRNNQGLQYYRIPRDPAIRKEYVRLLRNDNLKLEAENTRICCQHFEGGKKRSQDHLPSLFPWTIEKPKRRELKRISIAEVQENTRKVKKRRNASENTDPDEQLMNIDQSSCNKEESDRKSFSTVGTQTDFFSENANASTQTETFSGKLEVGTQTFSDELDVNSHEDKIQKLEMELEKLKREMEDSRFDIEQFKDKPQDIAFLTGFSDYETLMLCFDIVKEPANNLSYGSHQRKVFNSPASNKQGRPRKLTILKEFIMVLMKLRLGLFNRDLAHRFKISPTVVSEIFRTWIRFLRRELEVMIQLPPREVIQLHMPSLFKEFYPKTAIIIDCTEVEMERPSALNNQSACYSSYKSRTTMKALVGITPSGATAFVSELYPGSISDKYSKKWTPQPPSAR